MKSGFSKWMHTTGSRAEITEAPLLSSLNTEARVDDVARGFSRAISVRTDRAFAKLMIAQWVFTVGLAFWYTPRTWMGARSAVSPYLLLAIFFGGIISAVPATLAWTVPGSKLTRHVIAAGQMLMSSLIIHLTGGRIEAHFHIFGSLSFLALYLDWSVLLTATLVTALDHLLRGMLWPESIFGVIAAQPWRAVEHASWVIFCDVFLIGSCLDRLKKMRVIAEQQVKQGDLLRQAYTDVLTGLSNRLRFQNEVARKLNEEPDVPFSLMYIDLDHFKEINDGLGHAAGDKVLIEVAQRLTQTMPTGALVTRIGGDEFVAVLPGEMVSSALASLAEKLLTTLLLPLEVNYKPVKIGASIGISKYPEHGSSEEQLLQCADAAMYRMKRQGRLGFVFYDPLLDAGKRELDGDREKACEVLRAAVEHDEFEMHYQPLVDGEGNVKSMEALIRWISPTRGMIPPNDFIPLAESSGLIVPLGQLALDKVCAQAAAWRAQGVNFGRIGVNLSPLQLQRDEFLAELEQTMANHGVTGREVSFEITESAIASSAEVLEQRVRVLQEHGMQVSLDDFGTGYSSLGRLQSMSFDVVKIDRMFVGRLGESEAGHQVLEAIITLAHLLGMQVVAEGVETEEQYKMLQEMGCNTMQGYYVSRPLLASAMRTFLQEAGCKVETVERESEHRTGQSRVEALIGVRPELSQESVLGGPFTGRVANAAPAGQFQSQQH